MEDQLLDFCTALMVHIFLFDVIKACPKVKVFFVGLKFGVGFCLFVFLFITQNYNCELCFRSLSFAILGTITCVKEIKPQECILNDQEGKYRKIKLYSFSNL